MHEAEPCDSLFIIKSGHVLVTQRLTHSATSTAHLVAVATHLCSQLASHEACTAQACALRPSADDCLKAGAQIYFSNDRFGGAGRRRTPEGLDRAGARRRKGLG